MVIVRLVSVVIPRSRKAAIRIVQRYHLSKVRLLRRHLAPGTQPERWRRPYDQLHRFHVLHTFGHQQHRFIMCVCATPSTLVSQTCSTSSSFALHASSSRDCVRVIRLLWYQLRKWKFLCPMILRLRSYWFSFSSLFCSPCRLQLFSSSSETIRK